jgi:Fic family protein
VIAEYIPPLLPPDFDVESKVILRKLASTHRFLAELKGVSRSIPNQGILINTLSLQEAKDSSAIENIITTNDDLFTEDLSEYLGTAAAKEVRDYALALRLGYESVQQSQMISVNQIVAIYQQVKKTTQGIRRMPGTKLLNPTTNEVIFTPPQNHQVILSLMANLERYINDDTVSPADPLVKMAVMHYQFETIHPFSDGNGRTGRILNVLYLVLKDLLDIPVLYLSRYIIQYKADYYRLFQGIRDAGAWEEWVLFMLDGVEKTSRQTIVLIQAITAIMQDYRDRMRRQFKFYNQDLLNILFYHPYTKIEFLVREMAISRYTAARYLDELADVGFLVKARRKNTNYYINTALFQLLASIPPFE